jgi:hypothetical protein
MKTKNLINEDSVLCFRRDLLTRWAKLSLIVFTILGLVLPSKGAVSSGKAVTIANGTGNYEWNVDCVDCPSQFQVLGERSIQVDADGNPHIAYGGDNLYYAWKDAQSWHTQTIDTGGGAYASLALDSTGQPRIAFSAGNFLRFATLNDSVWTIENVTRGAGKYFSLAFDKNGKPWIAYYDPGVKELRIAFRENSIWRTSTVYIHDVVLDYPNPDNEVRGMSLALDSHGYPHISFLAYNTPAHYASWDGNGWTISDLPPVEFWLGATSLVIDDQDQPHLGFYGSKYEYPNNYITIEYTYSTNGIWQPPVIVDKFVDIMDTPFTMQLVLDSSESPLIGYIVDITDLNQIGPNYLSYAVKIAHQEGEKWVTQLVESSGYADTYASLAVEPSGNLQVIYMLRGTKFINKRGSELMYARSDTNWVPEKIDESILLGERTSGAFDIGADGYPQFAYGDFTHSQLKYTRWNGAAWQSEVVSDLDPAYRPFIGLSVDSQNSPHLFYSNPTGWSFVYAYLSSGEWNKKDILPEFTGDNNLLIDIDQNDRPHVINNITYAIWDGTQMAIQTGRQLPGKAIAFALDEKDIPHIVYKAAGQISYASWNEGTSQWNSQLLLNLNEFGGMGNLYTWAELLLDQNGDPVIPIGVYSLDNEEYFIINVAQEKDGIWSSTTIAQDVKWTKLTNFILAQDGNLNFVYQDSSNFGQYLAFWDGNMLRTELLPTAVYVGDWFASLIQKPSGEFVIAYEDDGDVKMATRMINYPLYLPLILR